MSVQILKQIFPFVSFIKAYSLLRCCRLVRAPLEITLTCVCLTSLWMQKHQHINTFATDRRLTTHVFFSYEKQPVSVVYRNCITPQANCICLL